MWDDIESKIRILKRRKRAQLSSIGRLSSKPNFHYKRAMGEIIVDPRPSSSPPKAYPCQIVLNDFTPRGVYISLPEGLPISTPIQLNITWSPKLVLHGRVISCDNISLNRRIISEQNFPYRVRIEFQFQTDEERDRFQGYYQDLMDHFLSG